MKILWLNANLLLPLDKGGKLRTWHLMRHLAARHAITYVSFVEPGELREHVEGMREVCDKLVTVRRSDVSKGSIRFYADAARYLVNPQPYAVAKYRSAEYAARVRELLAGGDYDLVVCDFLVPLVNMPPSLPCPAVLFTHNVEAEIWRRHAETATNPVSRRLLATQWRRMLRFERAALGRFDLVLTVSETDSRTFSRLYGDAAAAHHVVPTGVDTEYFAPLTDHSRKDEPHLVFTGSMDWLPNEDGMLYFVRDVLPLIREVEPAVTLSIVGRAPTPAVKRLAEERGITVTGRVEDVRPHVAPAAVYIVPLRIGGGTRLKIFEAMSMAKAVVSTTVGAEGLPVTDGRDIVIADEPADFARAVTALLRDPRERRRLETAARRLVVERYDWSAVSRQLESALVMTARTGAEPRVTQDERATA
jgi:sugar transferase (PEP-CTERM/EpsH1 system associated)